MTAFNVRRDNERDLKFAGEILGCASSTHDQNKPDYSGQAGCWLDLYLYRTTTGKFVCEQIFNTLKGSAATLYSGALCENIEEVIKFFGVGWLAKELYDSANIDASIAV
jgi:hypothetical protein